MKKDLMDVNNVINDLMVYAVEVHNMAQDIDHNKSIPNEGHPWFLLQILCLVGLWVVVLVATKVASVRRREDEKYFLLLLKCTHSFKLVNKCKTDIFKD